MFEQIFIDDDVKEFKKTFLNKIQTQNIYFDRYSLLSCLYLFNCKKILLKYERVLLRNYNAPIVDKGYNATIDRQFCKIAKLNTQFYLSDTPTPIVILLLMGNYKKALKLQKLLSTNEDETLKLNKILDYNQIDEVVISNGKIKKKPLTPKQIFVRVLLAIFCLIVFVVPTTLIINYIKIESNLIYTYSKEYDGYVVRCGKFYNPQILYIPNDYNGKDVVGIQSRAFTNKNNLKKVNLGVNLKFIENDCFFNCENLSEINILSNPNIPYEDLEKSTNKDVDIIIKFLISVFDGESLFKEFQVQFGSLFTFEKIEIPGYTFTGLFDDKNICIDDENGNYLDI